MIDTAMFFEEPHATQLEEARQMAWDKQGKHLPYQCFNAKVKEDRVRCACGRRLSGKKGATAGLISVLRGYSPHICKECPDFDGDNEVA